jgi:uncharacterized protein YpbB
MTEETEQAIRRAAAEAGIERLRPIKDLLGDEVSYDQIHLVVATMRQSSQLSASSQLAARSSQESPDGGRA